MVEARLVDCSQFTAETNKPGGASFDVLQPRHKLAQLGGSRALREHQECAPVFVRTMCDPARHTDTCVVQRIDRHHFALRFRDKPKSFDEIGNPLFQANDMLALDEHAQDAVWMSDSCTGHIAARVAAEN